MNPATDRDTDKIEIESEIEIETEIEIEIETEIETEIKTEIEIEIEIGIEKGVPENHGKTDSKYHRISDRGIPAASLRVFLPAGLSCGSFSAGSAASSRELRVVPQKL